MPIYEYRCQKCGHYLDVLQKVSDAPLEQCPECEADALKRLISAPAFRLKGGGWYETDFKSEKEKRRNLAESGNGKGDSGSSSGGESKSGSESKSGESSSKSTDGGSKSSDGSAKAGASGSQSKAAV